MGCPNDILLLFVLFGKFQGLGVEVSIGWVLKSAVTCDENYKLMKVRLTFYGKLKALLIARKINKMTFDTSTSMHNAPNPICQMRQVGLLDYERLKLLVWILKSCKHNDLAKQVGWLAVGEAISFCSSEEFAETHIPVLYGSPDGCRQNL